VIFSIFNKCKKLYFIIAPIFSVAIILSLWELFSFLGVLKEFLLPPPSKITLAFLNQYKLILLHAIPTLFAIFLSFICAFFIALLLSIFTVAFRIFELFVEPLLVISQVIPKVALAPLLLIIFGNGIESRSIIGLLICFFPFYSNAVQGMRSVNSGVILQADLLSKSKFEIMIYIRLIYSVPYIVSAAKSAILLAVIGVVVGEFVGTNNGLGYLILDSSARFDSELMFATIFFLSFIGGGLYVITAIIGDMLIKKTRLRKIK
jgi:NitT/TauT family transport system permease protein